MKHKKPMQVKTASPRTNMIQYLYQTCPKLGSWVCWQRNYYNNEILLETRVKMLNAVCFVWNSLDAQWMEMYNRLVTNEKEYKSTIVPRNFPNETWHMGS